MRQLKAYQTTKIGQIREALREDGIYTLNKQAAALGLPRSTAWTIMIASHKHTGLSSKTIKRMLGSQQLPLQVRTILLGYVEEKSHGHYGHDKSASKRFRTAIDSAIVQRVPMHSLLVFDR
jgi:hypothetical protein